jgi:hypothetical protein
MSITAAAGLERTLDRVYLTQWAETATLLSVANRAAAERRGTRGARARTEPSTTQGVGVSRASGDPERYGSRTAVSVTKPSLVRSYVFSLLAVVGVFCSDAIAQTDLSKARDLYRAAAYDDALAVLNPLRGATQPDADSPVVEEYRALCLIALGRAVEAERAMEAVVVRAPAYHLSGDDTPPRVRATFTDVRRRVLPGIIQQKYAEAKAAYDRKDTATAASVFKEVLAVLDDGDIAVAVKASPLAEIRTLASDFYKLSEAAAAPKPAPPPVVVSAPPPPPVSPPPPPAPVVPRIYGPEDANVVPPATLRQVLPPVGDVFAVRRGVVEIIIGETGAVEAATMRTAVNPVYDRLVLSAAQSWRYRAATLDGKPVKFRKIVEIDIKPR